MPTKRDLFLKVLEDYMVKAVYLLSEEHYGKDSPKLEAEMDRVRKERDELIRQYDEATD